MYTPCIALHKDTCSVLMYCTIWYDFCCPMLSGVWLTRLDAIRGLKKLLRAAHHSVIRLSKDHLASGSIVSQCFSFSWDWRSPSGPTPAQHAISFAMSTMKTSTNLFSPSSPLPLLLMQDSQVKWTRQEEMCAGDHEKFSIFMSGTNAAPRHHGGLHVKYVYAAVPRIQRVQLNAGGWLVVCSPSHSSQLTPLRGGMGPTQPTSHVFSSHCPPFTFNYVSITSFQVV